MKRISITALLASLLVFFPGCGSVEETLLVGGGEVPYGKLGITIFPRNRVMGDLATQMQDIKSLGFKHVRITFWFDESYMSSLRGGRRFAHFDEAVNAARAAGLEVVGILGYVPNWLRGGGWKNVFVSQYVNPLVRRYGGSVKYWEVWNEPDELTYDVLNGTPEDYFDLLKKVSSAIRAINPGLTIVSAATANITADGLDKFNWTERLMELGLSNYVDVLNFHYYADLELELSAFGGPLVKKWGGRVWVTEIGKSGQAAQKSYFEKNVAYVNKSLNPELIFWYCYVQGAGRNEKVSQEQTYGLRTVSGGAVIDSPLYVHLKNR